MAKYERKSGDQQYRRVYLLVESEPPFEPFVQNAEIVTYGENEVLEVLTDSGETNLFFGGAMGSISYSFPEEGILKITCGNPSLCARLWLRRGSAETLYKLPSTLPKGDDKRLCAHVPGATGDVTLVGDKYLRKAYNIRAVE